MCQYLCAFLVLYHCLNLKVKLNNKVMKKIICSRAGNMAQWVKVFGAKPKDFSSILGTHIVEEN